METAPRALVIFMATSENSSLPKFYFISALVPNNTRTGGEIVLYRHFVQRRDFDYEIVHVPRSIGKFFQWLEQSRFRTYVRAFTQWYERFDLTAIRNLPKPSFIVTVAHSRECFAAAAAASFWKVPLVTFFHDWYPASSDVHPRLRFMEERAFVRLYRRADLALCVSEAMLKALGPHRNAIVLPPIPSANHRASGDKKNERPGILYSGLCGGVYALPLKVFAEELANRGLQVSLTGDGSEAFAGMKGVTVHGFVDEKKLGEIIESCDILVLFLSFDPSRRKHFSTHFPSKLVEYTGNGKVIGIWGPSWSTAVQWANQTGAAWSCESPDVSQFVAGLLDVYTNDSRRREMLEKAEVIYKESFSSDTIHRQLVRHIMKLL